MRLYTVDEQRMVDVGTGSIWHSIFSTAMVSLPKEIRERIPFALQFLRTGECQVENLSNTMEQIKMVREGFRELNPSMSVYDIYTPNLLPPWNNNIAPSVTSCANLYTTADGKDLFSEVIKLFEYAITAKVSINAG